MGPSAVALVPGARLATRSADTHYPFRQDSDFHYLTGFDHPNAVALLRTDGGPAFTLYVEPRQRDAEIWTGYRPGVEGAQADFGADAAHPIDELLASIPKLLEKARRVFVPLGRDTAIDAKLTESIDALRLRSRAGIVPPSEMQSIRARSSTRCVSSRSRRRSRSCAAPRRSPAKPTAQRRARRTTVASSTSSRRRSTSTSAVVALPVRRTAPSSAVAPTPRCSTTYANSDPLRSGDLVLIDAGCELECYASDVTRSYPVGGRFEGGAKEIYEIVLASQEAALSVAKPGATLDDVHSAALRKLTEGMVDIGLLSGSVDGLLESDCLQDVLHAPHEPLAGARCPRRGRLHAGGSGRASSSRAWSSP